MKIERRVHFEPAFDRRMEEGGVGGVAMNWYMIGEEGAVHWRVATNWQLEDIQNALDHDVWTHALCHPIPATLCYHGRQQRGMEPARAGCEVLGGVCYWSANPLAAVSLYELLTRFGDGAVWQQMFAYYLSYFNPALPETP